MTPIIQSIRDYVMQYPGLDENGCLYVDYLGNEPIEYSVEAVPAEPFYRRYTDGDGIRQFLFLFASREYYSADVTQCIENLGFYEGFERWIREQNENGILPDLGPGREPIAVQVLTGGYGLSQDESTARYQMQLRLLYKEEST